MAQQQPAPNQPVVSTEDRGILAVVKQECPPELLERIKFESQFAVNKFNTHREMAEYLKKKMDEIDRPTWNVIVGHNFASNVKHIAERFVYFYIDQLGFLLFKTQ